ncbi:3-isopropylmalate dehydratase small subunit [Candidatus Bathyarchaeota archaeon]|nr:3-isopropylmalate dehydratase small subunit [Candidatus Bathyarchaeota archaeon]
MKIRGKVTKFGDDINTDVIIPSKYLVYTNPKDLAKYAMAGIDPDFSQVVKEKNIVVAGKNFGCGSSREQAPVALKYVGVNCILADSFARIFFRNAINIGLPILEHDGISKTVRDGDELDIDLKTGIVKDVSLAIELRTKPLPDFLMDILEKGLVNYIKERRKI